MQLSTFPPVDGAGVLLAFNFSPHFQQEILNFQGNQGFQHTRDLIFNEGFPRLGSHFQAAQSSPTTCLTNYSSDLKGTGKRKDWGRNFSLPKCLSIIEETEQMLHAIQSKRCTDITSRSGMGLRTHLLTETGGKAPNTKRKGMRASYKPSPYIVISMYLCSSFSCSQTGHAGWHFQHKKEWTHQV